MSRLLALLLAAACCCRAHAASSCVLPNSAVPPPSAGAPSLQLTLAAEPSLLSEGKPLLLTAKLAASATGSIAFLDGSSLLGKTVVSPDGSATLGVSCLTAGTHLLTAQYTGAQTSSQTSNTITLAVTAAESSFHLQAYPLQASAGEPIAVDAVGLPPDATGTIDYRDNGRLVATVRLAGTRIGRYEAFGDSITAGAGNTSPAHAYPALVGSALGLMPANHARNGSIACEMMSDGILPHGSGATQADLPLFSMMVGTNDADIFYRLPAHDNIYRNCHRAALAWLGVAREHKVLAGDPEAQPGDSSWTLDAGSADAGLHTLFHRTGSGTARFTLATGGRPVYLWYLENDLLPGTFTLSIDGVATGTVYRTQMPEYQPILNDVSIGFDRLPLPAGTHVFEIQAVSGSVGIVGFGTPAAVGAGEPRPTVLVGDVPHQLAFTALLTEQDLDHYTYLIQTGLALLGQDGLDLRFVRTRDDLLGNIQEMIDGLHPNDFGAEKLARAFTRVYGTPAGSVAGSATLRLAAGAHQLTASYSGDDRYAGSTSAPVSVSLSDASTATTVSASTVTPAFGSSVTLTAAVAPGRDASPDAGAPTGSVTFWDGGRTPVGSAPLVGSEASVSVLLPVGRHSITAVYTSDLWRPGSTSSPLQLDVEPRDQPTQVRLSATGSAGSQGTRAVLNSVVSAPYPLTPDGAVTFFDGATPIGEATLAADGSASLVTADLSDGTHSFRAAYQGNTRFLPATSSASSLTVRFAATQMTLTSATTRYVARQPVSVTVTLSPASATGSVTLFDQAAVLAILPLVNGTATYTSSSLALGTHALSAAYSGDTYDASAQSPTLEIAVDQVTTSITLSGAHAQAPYGAAGTLVATLAPVEASGTITFTDSLDGRSTLLAASTVAQGQATLPLDTLAVGSHTLTASYSGDPSDLPASATVAIEIAALPTHTTLSTSVSTLRLGETATLTATVSPSSLTGQISLRDQAGVELQRLTPVDGVVAWSSARWSPGPHTVTATYLGDATHGSSSSAGVALEVKRRLATVLLAPLPATVYVGSSTPLSAQIIPADATGTVTFVLADGTAIAQAQLSHGTASATLPSLQPGSYRIAATYSGDVQDEPTSTDPIGTRIALNPTTLALSGLPASMPFSTPFTLQARVSPGSATGTVTFTDSAAGVLGSAPLIAGSASLSLHDLPVGMHSIVATYAGDAMYAAASTAAQATEVTPDTSSTELRLAQVDVPAGSPAIFNVRVQTLARAVPTGTITIRSGSRVLAQGALGNGSPGVAYATLTAASASLGLGTFPVVAYYSGDADNTLSDSAAATLVFHVIATPVQAVLSLSASRVPVSTAIRASVVLTANGSVPSGSVTFTLAGRALATLPVDATGQAAVTLPSLPIGSYSVTAAYVPGGLFGTGTIAPATLTVTAPVALAFTAQTISAAAGSTQNATLAVTPLSGFAGAIQTTCGTSATFLHCSVQGPATVGGGDAQLTVHVAVDRTLAASTLLPQPGLVPLACVLLLPWLVRRSSSTSKGQATRLWLSMLALGLAMLSLSGCGSTGGNFFAIPAGTQKVEVTVTAAGVAVSANLAVEVTP